MSTSNANKVIIQPTPPQPLLPINFRRSAKINSLNVTSAIEWTSKCPTTRRWRQKGYGRGKSDLGSVDGGRWFAEDGNTDRTKRFDDREMAGREFGEAMGKGGGGKN
jgi:hypothetical protein